MAKLTCPTCQPIDCCPPSGLDDYLLVGPSVLNNQVTVAFDCPEGYVCDPGVYPVVITIDRGRLRWSPPSTPPNYPLQLRCCDGVIVRVVPSGISQAAYQALLQGMADEWARRQAGCEEKSFRGKVKRFTNDAQTVRCSGTDQMFNVSGLPLSAFLPTSIQISADGRGLTIRSGVFGSSLEQGKAVANAEALAYVTQKFNEAIAAGNLQCGTVPAPCDLGVADNTIISAASSPNPQPLNDTLTYLVGIGQYEWFYVTGAYKSDDNPQPGLWKITQERAVVNNGASVNDLVQAASYGAATPAAAIALMSADAFRTRSFYHHLTQIEHRFVGQNPTNFVAGSPNPTWRIRRTKRPQLTPPARLRVKDFATAFAPALVGCSGATNGVAEPVWDGTFPNTNFSNPFSNWEWNPDFSLGLQLNGKVLTNGSTQLYHSGGGLEPTSTGCAWVLGVDFDVGFGSWVGLGGNGYDPAGTYLFNPAASGWSLCSQKTDVRVATVTPLPANARVANVITASANGVLPAIDGVTLVAADRVLVKNEADLSNNGLYVVTSVGSAGTPWVLTRSTDADTSPEVTQGMFAKATQGTVNAGSYFRLITLDPITLNTDSLTFLQIPPSITVEVY